MLPLLVAAIVLQHRHWWPTGDLAQAEMRVRSLWSHPPLIGAAGRIGTLARRGSHPGPLAFWLLWPVYRLFGATPWALLAAVATLHAAGAATALAVARRVAGRAGLLGAALALAGLFHGFTLDTLLQPWNPYLPLVWFAATVTLTWAVIAGHTRLWPALVAAGSFCVQCHVGFLGPVGGLGAVALAISVWKHRAEWRQPLIGILAGLVLWTPPVVDQLTRKPGNFGILIDYFRHPPEAAIGLGEGLATVLRLLNPVGGWLTGSAGLHSSLLPGAVLVVAWLLAVTWTVPRRAELPSLFALHLTVAASLLFTTVAVSRIFGRLFSYLVLWIWVITATALAATIATAIAALARRRPVPDRARRLAAVTAVGVVAASSLALCWSARGLPPPYEPYSKQMAALVPRVAATLDRHGRYQVIFDDPISLGGDAYGLLLELERRGFTAGAPPAQRVAVEPHRVLPLDRATAVLAVVSGPPIAAWKARRGARLLAEVDPRSAAQRASYLRLRAEAIAGLRRARLDSLVPKVDESIWLVANDTRTPRDVIADIGPMIDMGLPTAVFEVEPSVLR